MTKRKWAKWVVGLAVVLVLGLPQGLLARTGGVFDYSGRRLGLGGYAGLGVATSDVGAGFQFGVTAKVKIWQGIQLDPGFNMFVRSGYWDMVLAPAPQYIFRLRRFPIHPYAGFGPALHIWHAGGSTTTYDYYTGGFYRTSYSETEVKFGLHWTVGAEWAINERVSLYNDYKFHLVFDAPDLFTMVVGVYYFIK